MRRNLPYVFAEIGSLTAAKLCKTLRLRIFNRIQTKRMEKEREIVLLSLVILSYHFHELTHFLNNKIPRVRK